MPEATQRAYAGVGSRRTPRQVLERIENLAESLGNAGYALSSGGAIGADAAFATGALRTHAPITVHTPWPGYNGYHPGRETPSDIDVLRSHPRLVLHNATYEDHARRAHPFWTRCGRGAQALFIRNIGVLAGAVQPHTPDLAAPAFVLAWTPNGLSSGRSAGGTGHTLRVADTLRIPSLNLSRASPPAHNAATLRDMPADARRAILAHFPDLPR